MDYWILDSITILVVIFIVNIIIRILFKRIREKSKWLRDHEYVTPDHRFPPSEWISWPKENFYVPLVILIAIFSFLLIPIFIYNLISGDINNVESVIFATLLFSFFLVPAFVMLRSACTRFKMSPEGIERQVAWLKGKLYRWDEILGIWHNDNFLHRNMLIKTTKGRFWISMDMQGIQTFSSFIIEKVPEERWKRVGSILLSSADRAQMIPSKQDRKRMRREFSK